MNSPFLATSLSRSAKVDLLQATSSMVPALAAISQSWRNQQKGIYTAFIQQIAPCIEKQQIPERAFPILVTLRE
jgi:hypothetical protein